MDSRTMHPGKYLKAADFEKAQMWTIADLRQEAIQNQQTGQSENKWILYFHDDDRGMVLNVVNRIALEEYLGFETDDWIDKQVVLYKDKVAFGGKMVDAIRLRQPRKAALKPPAQPSPAAPVQVSEYAGEPEFSDDIPF